MVDGARRRHARADAVPAEPAPGNGRVDVHLFEQEADEAEWIAAEMQKIHMEENISYRRMGIFVRSIRRFIPDLLKALERRQIPYLDLQSGMSDRPAVQLISDLVVAATGSDGPAETSRATKRILLGPLYKMSPGMIRRIEKIRANTIGGTWAKAIRAALPSLANLVDLLDDPYWAKDLPAAIGLFHVWSRLAAEIPIVTDPTRENERTDWGNLSLELHRWNERNPLSTLVDYQRATAEEEFAARTLFPHQSDNKSRPTIASLHQSKGLEFDFVFIADAVEGSFPDIRSKDSLLGVRHLLEYLPKNETKYRAFRLQEERRLAYTAMSRAKKRVIWTATTTNNCGEGRGAPSRFLDLVAKPQTLEKMASASIDRLLPITPREAEGRLRRLLRNPEARTRDRLAALTVLAEHRDNRMRYPLEYVGMRNHADQKGIVPEQPLLSPSQAEAYLQCPRRYVLERRLQIKPGPSVHMRFGALIHKVLERTEKRALQSGTAHGTLDEAMETYRDSFTSQSFGDPPFSDSWWKRGKSMLTRLYENWPSSGFVQFIEYPLELKINSTNWHGRIDRIEVKGDQISIVDYKTSRLAMKVATAAESLQLGFYLLALEQDPIIRHSGRVSEAEYWYPGAPGRRIVRRKFDIEKLGQVKNLLTKAALGITSENWTPLPGPQCERCPQRPICPAWSQRNGVTI